MAAKLTWNKLCISRSEVELSKVLRCGQTFRWKNIDDVWTFTIKDRIVLLRQNDDAVEYSHVPHHKKSEDGDIRSQGETRSFLQDYFNLDITLGDLYEHWSKKDGNFKRVLKSSPFQEFKGIRILRQDPWETLVSFICSSNNNVKRISKMCEALCVEFGDYVNEYAGVKHYSFPSPEQLLLSPSLESRLRELGFGYRAKYIHATASRMTADEYPDITVEKLNLMRQEDYETAHNFLLQLMGVGPKVADCICLMALDKHDVVPVDTHVYQIALRDYKFKGKRDLKTLNPKVYNDIRLHFKNIFGDFAGWAQSVLFTSDLSDLNNGINKIEQASLSVKRLKTELENIDHNEAEILTKSTVSKRIKVEV